MSVKSISEIFSRTPLLSEFENQYHDPEWKSFAREMRQKAGGCQICKRNDLLLHVHHFAYDRSRKMWEYGPDEVAVLCENCYKAMHECLNQFRKHVFGCLKPDSLRVLNGALAVATKQYDALRFAYAVAEMAASPGSVERFCEAWINSTKKKPLPAQAQGVKGPNA